VARKISFWSPNTARVAVPGRSRRLDPRAGPRGDARLASALRAAPSSYGWSRTHVCRRGGEAPNDYKPENGPRRPRLSICTGAVRQPSPTPSEAPERSGANAADKGHALARGRLGTGAPKAAASLLPFVRRPGATARARGRLSAASVAEPTIRVSPAVTARRSTRLSQPCGIAIARPPTAPARGSNSPRPAARPQKRSPTPGAPGR
jgi:hypothetical protein